jgi:FkbM family methyltransferase
MEFFSNCFDKHNFDELNNIDVDKLQAAVQFFFNTTEKKMNYVFFDVGTNAGSFIKVLTNLGMASSNIHCFEPHPVLSGLVKALFPTIVMNEFCISNQNGTTTIHIPEHSVGLSSLIKRPVFSELGQKICEYTTPTKTLDAYCEENGIQNIDFIKIDVEGAEKMVFEGAASLLAQKRIRAGLFEVGTTLTDAGTSDAEIISMLENYGYAVNKSLESDYYFYLSSSSAM